LLEKSSFFPIKFIKIPKKFFYNDKNFCIFIYKTGKVMKMMFYSTNHDTPIVDFKQALFTGQAPDRGLYMPEFIPTLTPGELSVLKEKNYPEIAFAILEKFIEKVIPSEELRRLCRDAYDYPIPVERVTDTLHVMRLDRGPTASFKDFAARMMARMMKSLRPETGKKLVVLTATSGDTGSAIAHAYYGIPDIDVIVLFPPAEVSGRQRRQMTTLGGNVTAIGIDGKFDHCQSLVKGAFSDPELDAIDLTSANSINIGRLLPQIVYYVYAHLQIAAPAEPVAFSVPSGNFGDMMGALLAKRMGLPVSRIIVATNANDEVPKFLETGIYSKIDPSRVCISNAMNVGHPSNFARVVDLYGGRMDEKGNIRRQPDMESMKRDLYAVSIDDSETRRTIKNSWDKHRLLLESHGAVGWAGLERYLEATGDKGPCVSVETAHPAKFPEEIESLLGFAPEVPKSLTGIESKEESYIRMPVDYAAFRNFLWEKYIK
jgi:threonine synthase